MLVEKGCLYQALKRLVRVATGEPSDALGCVQVTATDTSLALAATDLSSWLRVTIPADGHFSAMLPARALLEFVKPMDRADESALVEFMAVENQQVVVAIEGAMITLPGSLPAGFPDLPSVLTDNAGAETVTWSARDARSLLGWVSKAVTNDPTRPQLSGILFDGEHVVATDGHRMHIGELAGFGRPMLLPARGIQVLLRCMPRSGQVDVQQSDEFVRFRAHGWELALRPMDERFPSYLDVVPKVANQEAVFEVGRAAMKRLFAGLPRSTDSVRVNVNGSLEVFASSSNDNKPNAVANAALLDHQGADIDVRVNPRYLREAVSVGGDVVIGRFEGALAPLLLEPGPGMLAVVLPQRD